MTVSHRNNHEHASGHVGVADKRRRPPSGSLAHARQRKRDGEAPRPSLLAATHARRMSVAGKDHWQGGITRSSGSTPFLPWLRDRGSLTARIQSRGRFAVRVLRQRRCQPTADEAQALGLAPVALAWVREVALSCDERIVVFAHTVLPCQPRGPLTRWLARLGTRSLGALLFAHVGFSRGPMKFRRLDQRHALFAPAVKALQFSGPPPRTLWARRSQFGFGAQSVLVTEVFSPVLLAPAPSAAAPAGGVGSLRRDYGFSQSALEG
ncbi:MAG: chorismate pyruvate lyase [Candidatus Accumulibacter sp. SK-11]|nr:MAG: chorismate pyruvate lyase [Candidatus Accumulibacter sp. SK-11]